MGPPRSQRQMDAFREALDRSSLVDLGYSGDLFTWKRSVGKGNVTKEGLDRFVAKPNFLGKFNKITVDHLNYLSSDHRPIIASLDSVQNSISRKSSGTLRFEESWIEFDECRNIIDNHWKGSSAAGIGSFCNKIKECLVKLSRWNKIRLGGSIKAAITRKEEDIRRLAESEDRCNNDELDKEEKALEVLLKEKERYWKLRSRED